MNSTSLNARIAVPVKAASDKLMEPLTREVGGCHQCGRKRLLTDVVVCWACPSLFREDAAASGCPSCPRNN